MVQTSTMPDKAVQTENDDLFKKAKFIVENFNKIEQYWKTKENNHYLYATFGCAMTLILLSRL